MSSLSSSLTDNSPVSITEYGISPNVNVNANTKYNNNNDILDTEYVISELRKLQSSYDIKQYLSALLDSHKLYYNIYKCSNIDELILLLAYDCIIIINNTIKLKQYCDNNINILCNNINSINNKSLNINKFALPYYFLVISCSLMVLISDHNDGHTLYPSYASY